MLNEVRSKESFVNLMLHWKPDVLFGQSTGSSGRDWHVSTMLEKPYVMERKVLYDVKRPILGPEKAIWFLSNYSYFKIAIWKGMRLLNNIITQNISFITE